MRHVFIRRTTGNEGGDATRRGWNVTTLAPASFEVERFELAGEACIEVRGRWSGVRGRRFMRPTLTARAGGREQRILAVLDHKPWIAEEGEIWLAAFPCTTDPASLRDAELTVAPDVTVPLAPPSAYAHLPTELRELERLRLERDEALTARDGALAERHDAIEAEVALRIADLRAEAEREQAGARLAAQTARERDAARVERDEAARERDAARVQRDGALHERNRMLAERDTAQTRVEEVNRQWEMTAALGTRRTLERDAVAVERESAERDRDAAVGERDAALRERDTLLQERGCAERERDAALAERDGAARESPEATVAFEHAEVTPVSQQTEATSEWRPLIVSERRLTAHGLLMPVGGVEGSGLWRARMLAGAALLIAATVLLVLVLAR
jgi:hypothetical protein